MKKIIIIILLGWFCFSEINAQIYSDYKKNVLKLSGSAIPSSLLTYSIDYEYFIFNYRALKFSYEATVGQYFQMTAYNESCFQTVMDFLSITNSVNSFLGKKSHYLELNTGIRYSFFDKAHKHQVKQWLPVLNIGYRYQNSSGKGLIFRTFFGITGFGISIGKSF